MRAAVHTMRPYALSTLLAALAWVPVAALAAGEASAQARPQAAAANPGQAASQEGPAEGDEARRKLEAEIAKELGAGPEKGTAPAAPQPPGGTAPTATGGNPYSRLLLLPDISVIGDFALAFDSYDVAAASPRPEPFGPPSKPEPIFQEVELGLQSVVDPYVRADVFGSLSSEGAEIEEAYLTTLALPAGFQVRAGKLFSPFGRLNQQHPHAWDFVDAPLAAVRLLADDVLSGPGADVAWLAPLPWFAELRIAGQGTAPQAGDVERLTGVVRLLQYFPVGAATTLGVGLSAGTRDEGAGAFRDLAGADAYLRWRPAAGRSWLALQGEMYGRRFRGMPGDARAGGWVQAFWRDGPYRGYGIRWENAPSAGDAAAGREQRTGAVATWFPSEFQKYRVQVSWDRRPRGRDGVEALLQVEFVMGSHGAHPF